MGWLADSMKVKHVDANPIHQYSNKQFPVHEIMKCFYAKTTTEKLKKPLNGKRLSQMCLASSEDIVGKAAAKGLHQGSGGPVAAIAVTVPPAVAPIAGGISRADAPVRPLRPGRGAGCSTFSGGSSGATSRQRAGLEPSAGRGSAGSSGTSSSTSAPGWPDKPAGVSSSAHRADPAEA